ncbi:Protein of unknown function [Gryllus bimaculatus]|nr:Protein of unknown function [Gryllus bimaculatus]
MLTYEGGAWTTSVKPCPSMLGIVILGAALRCARCGRAAEVQVASDEARAGRSETLGSGTCGEEHGARNTATRSHCAGRPALPVRCAPLRPRPHGLSIEINDYPASSLVPTKRKAVSIPYIVARHIFAQRNGPVALSISSAFFLVISHARESNNITVTSPRSSVPFYGETEEAPDHLNIHEPRRESFGNQSKYQTKTRQKLDENLTTGSMESSRCGQRKRLQERVEADSSRKAQQGRENLRSGQKTRKNANLMTVWESKYYDK